LKLDASGSNPLSGEKTYTIKECLKCNKPYIVKHKRQKYCSEGCANKAAHKVEHPSKEELEKLVWEKPTLQLAKDFGVSDKAIEKWCKKYGIEKPPRGYWAKKRAKK